MIAFRLDDYMARSKPHSVRNRLFVAAIEQTQRDQQQRQPETQGQGGQRVPRGLRQRLRQLIFTRRRRSSLVRPYESLPSAGGERLAMPDRAQKPGP